MTEKLTLRPATIDDAERLLAWRNDPETSAASHNDNIIAMTTHLSWLRSSLSSQTRVLKIAEYDGRAVGTVRADLVDNAWKLSWTIAPEARGKGHAQRMVCLMMENLDGHFLAEVKADNISSQKVAERAGMALQKQENGVLFYKKA